MPETAAACGVTVAIENLLPDEDGGRLGSRPEHFERFARAFDHPNMGFCLDTGHALVAGRQEAHAFPAAMGERLIAFHLADNAGDRGSHLAQQDYGHSVCIETPSFDFGPDFTDDAWKRWWTTPWPWRNNPKLVPGPSPSEGAACPCVTLTPR